MLNAKYILLCISRLIVKLRERYHPTKYTRAHWDLNPGQMVTPSAALVL